MGNSNITYQHTVSPTGDDLIKMIETFSDSTTYIRSNYAICTGHNKTRICWKGWLPANELLCMYTRPKHSTETLDHICYRRDGSDHYEVLASELIAARKTQDAADLEDVLGG